MAVDTAAKRASCLGVGSSIVSMLPIPDGAIAQADRQDVAFNYSGILADSPAEADGDKINSIIVLVS